MINCRFEDGGNAQLRHGVVNVLVIKDDKILLVKRAERLTESGKWCLPGGFMDRDENSSHTALRELREETGWLGEVKSLFCIISNPDRDNEDRQNVAFCYVLVPIKVTGQKDSESTDIKWFSFKEVEHENVAFDHGRIIKKYEEYHSKPFTLPLLIESGEDY